LNAAAVSRPFHREDSMNSKRPAFHPGLHRFAQVVMGCTFLLLLAGALVTSTGSSLSVPDWPLSYGTLFPHMTGGVIFEHGHRLVAGTVSILMLALASTIQRVESRSWVKKLAWSAMGAVLLQALLGGLTVLFHLPTPVSVCHAGLAQIFFCLVTTLAVVTSKSWIEETPGRLRGLAPSLPTFAAATVAAIYVQVLLGALTRHSGAGLAMPDFPPAFVPAEWSPLVLIHFCHRLGAVVVTVLVSLLVYRVNSVGMGETALTRPAIAAGLLLWLQLFLGVMIIVTAKAVVPTSVHVITGAALLASTLVTALKCFQLFGDSRSGEGL
jgi:cytochrome c oxidase assembly protein subunit 15